jgi:asparagine synthetase B (glutamine-hydrolysing)
MSPAEEPFVHIRVGSGIRVDGMPVFRLGHVLPRGHGIPDGIFAEWQWDGRELIARNDRYGFQPLFLFTKPDEICLAPSVRTLLARGAPRELDWDALAVFLRLGFFLGDDTPFRAIRAVPPNAVLCWNGAELTVRASRVKWPVKEIIDRTAAIRTYQALFAEAVRRRRPEGPFGLLLSGGRDSRHILFESYRQGWKPELTATVDLPGSTDGPIGEAIAKELGLRHWRVAPPRPSVGLEQQKNWETHFCADEHAWILGLRDALRGRCAILYDGIGGDVLSAGLFLDQAALDLFRARRFTDLARSLVTREHPVPFVTRLLNAEMANLVSDERAVARIGAELERHADAANPCASFFFWNRTRREIALSPFSLFGTFRVYAPYLDHDLVDFLSSLPAELLLDHSFHDETIAQSYPEWSHIPYAVKKAPRFRFADLALAWQARRLLRKRHVTGLNLQYLLPRLLRAGLDPIYNRRSIEFLTVLPTYWAQLQDVASGVA